MGTKNVLFLANFSPCLAASSLGQQLQQDPNDPTKWQVVTTGAPQATQLVTVTQAPAATSGQLSSPSTTETMEVVMAADAPASGTSNTTQAKPRLRRVACTCPNCKDGEGKQ